MTDPTQTPEARAYRAGAEAMREKAATKAREWAAHYDVGTDGQNTFILFAEWAEAIPLPDAPVREVSVRIKPLVWEGDDDASWAETEIGEYRAFLTGAGHRWSRAGSVSGHFLNSMQEAKAAAQDSHERRILSALEEGLREVSVAEAAKVLLMRVIYDEKAPYFKAMCDAHKAGSSWSSNAFAAFMNALRALAGEAEHG